MVTNPFSKLPSISELLESPTLKALVDHIHPSTIMSTARCVLDEVTAEAQHAAAERSLPNMSELVERIARRVIYGDVDPRSLHPVINATGCFYHPRLGPPPLASVAVEAIQATTHSYLAEVSPPRNIKKKPQDEPICHTEYASCASKRFLEQIERSLHRMTGAEAVWICCDEGPAVYAICKSLCTGTGAGGLIVARMDMIRRSNECCLPDLIRETTGHWEEVGTIDRVTIDDYRVAIEDEAGAFGDLEFPEVLFYVEPMRTSEPSVADRATIAELATLKRKHDMTLVCELGAASLVDLTKYGIEGVPNAKQAITDGADLVVMNVELLGVPRCAIVLGSKKVLEKVRHRNMVTQLAPTPGESTLAALAAVLTDYRSTETLVRTVPILELLSVSAENLKNRAERLAPQLAILPEIESATPVEATLVFRATVPTWKIVLQPKGMSARELATKLAKADPGIVVGIEEETITLDLRTIFARQDVEIFGIFEKVFGIV